MFFADLAGEMFFVDLVAAMSRDVLVGTSMLALEGTCRVILVGALSFRILEMETLRWLLVGEASLWVSTTEIPLKAVAGNELLVWTLAPKSGCLVW